MGNPYIISWLDSVMLILLVIGLKENQPVETVSSLVRI